MAITDRGSSVQEKLFSQKILPHRITAYKLIKKLSKDMIL